MAVSLWQHVEYLLLLLCLYKCSIVHVQSKVHAVHVEGLHFSALPFGMKIVEKFIWQIGGCIRELPN